MSAYSYYEDKRDHPRINSAVFVKYDIRDEVNQTLANGVATTRDLSLGGMRFICPTPVRKDYILKMQIQLDRFTNIAALGTVAWVKEIKPGQFMVGIQFNQLPEQFRGKIIKYLNSFAPGAEG